jgi:hypothetical protein
MKYILLLLLLILSGCATLPVCKKDQSHNCRKLDAGDMGGTVRGFRDAEQ